MCTKNELNDILKEVGRLYSSVYGGQLVKIFLYGSYARGDYDEESDIDIVALVRRERELLQKKLKKVWYQSSELELEFGTILSPSVIPYDEYQKYRDDLPYYRNIEREGVELA